MADSDARSFGSYDALLLISLLWFLAKSLRYAFPPLFEALQVEYGASDAILGGAFTAFMLVYAAMQFPSGVLGDRLGAVRVVATGAVVAAAGSFVIAAGALPGLDAPFWLVVAAMVVIGAGTGAHKTVAITLLSRIYPSRSGRALGVHDTLGTFAGVAAPTAVALAIGAAIADWRVLFLAAGVVGVAGAGAFAIRVPRRIPDDDRQSRNANTLPLRAYARPFRSGRFSAFVLVTLCFGFAYNGVVAFLPLYLGREAGVTTAVASLLFGVLFAVSVVQLATGEYADRIGRLPVIVSSIGLATVALAVLVVVPGIGPTWAGVPLGTAAVVGVLGVGTHGFRPVRAAHLDALLPNDLAGGGLGVVRTGLMGAGAIAPAIVGLVAAFADVRVAFSLLLIVLGTALAIAASLWATSARTSTAPADDSVS